MSGGSFNYLYCQDIEHIFGEREIIKEMAEALKSLGYADDVAYETSAFLKNINDFERRMNNQLRRLEDVWKAMEWWRSGDWSEQQLKDALEKFRQ